MKNNSLRSNVAPQDDEQQTSQESHGHDESDADHDDGGHDKDGHDHDEDGHDHDEDGHDHDEDGHDHDEGGHDEGGHDHGGDTATTDQWNDGVDLAMGYYLSPDSLIGHVQDSDHFELPAFPPWGEGMSKGKLSIPQISPYTDESPMMGENGSVWAYQKNDFVGPVTFQPTKFVVLELIGALIVAAIFIPYAKRIKSGNRPVGRFWNVIDVMVCYIRDEVAVPGIGSADAKRFLPFIWTIFFFVLTLNLLGMVPGLGAATGSISVTAALAISVFFVVMATGIKKMGFAGFVKAQAPHLDINPVVKIILVPMIWGIEVFGLFIKHAVLAVRLFANMFAGHLVVGVFVAFIGVTWHTQLIWGVGPAVIVATIAVNVLELLVAFIQAYVFAFLTSLFIGAAIHPH
ncbi:MAG: F0F1 ATP synthase subunit A [Mariniblastus sp.]|nr:F0F1 ATP synthase subunit A [Mariniblastus sp.]